MLTPIGVFIYNVLAMGLTNASDIFEQCLYDILHGLDGVFNIADDILVIGEIYAEFKDNVIRFLDQCVEKDLHLNADKFKLDCDTVTFFGHLLTKDGMKPDPKSEGCTRVACTKGYKGTSKLPRCSKLPS